MRKHYTPDHKAKVVLEILKEEQTLAQISAVYGVHPTQLGKWKAQALEGLPRLFDDERKVAGAREGAHGREREELYAEIGRLTTQLPWLQKNLASTLTLAERVSLTEREDPDMSQVMQAELLGLNRTGLYYLPVAPSAEELYLKRRIDEIYTAHPFYGSRKITAELRRELVINRKAVQRHMREMGLAGIYPGPNLSRRNAAHAVYPDLLRNVTAQYPDHHLAWM